MASSPSASKAVDKNRNEDRRVSNRESCIAIMEIIKKTCERERIGEITVTKTVDLEPAAKVPDNKDKLVSNREACIAISEIVKRDLRSRRGSARSPC
ncbi:unnamed protein product [Microthlaspi erraticum]|uniref:Uncharacterized protein n=1 Tax=Microthlaspi erraticum TaxID=1685480 RepID=A0A6D2I4V1_9BRAS|nr:unnamed protein product [Microthlaspi erraticum]